MHVVVYQYLHMFSQYQGNQQLKVELPSGRVIEGKRVEFTCVTDCPLTGGLATFTWYKDGSLLLGQSQRQQLVLDPVRVEDMGNYSCALAGPKEIRSQPVQLLVQCKSL